jgi:adenylate cyclase
MLTLPRFFALMVGTLALAAGLILSSAVRTASSAATRTGDDARQAAADRIARDVERELGAAEEAIRDFEEAQGAGLVDDASADSTRVYLSTALIARRGLSELTLTSGRLLGYDDDGNATLAPEGRRQVTAYRSASGALGHHVISTSAAGAADDPTLHDTFQAAAHRETRGRALWSDLSYSQLDGQLPPERRRKVMTVQKAIFARAGGADRFVGVLRAGIVSETLDRIGAERAPGNPTRLFICDSQGRLVTRLEAGDAYQLVNERGAPDPDGDLRVVSRAPSAEVGAALGLAASGALGGRRLQVGDETLLVTLLPLAEGRAQGWRAAVVVPESFYIGPLTAARNRLLMLLAAAGLLVVVVAFVGARAVRRGMKALVSSTDGMRAFSFQPGEIRSPFAEVRGALESVERAKTALRAMVKYVPVGLVKRLYQHGREPTLGAEVMEVSLMFTDIANFTTHAESLPPARLAEALGRYLEAATVAVERTGGTVDKYIGDALMVLWNAPTDVADHAAAACRGALACLAATDALGASPWWREQGLPPWGTRFGLHRDRVLVGHFGAPERLSYTAMGDGVNLAARLEGLNKVYGTTILASEAIREAVGDAFVFRKVDRVAVKGKARGVVIYELLGAAGDARLDGMRARVEAYEAALAAAHERQFERALSLLATLRNDQTAAVLAGRCQAWLKAPPPADWDGTWVAATK